MPLITCQHCRGDWYKIVYYKHRKGDRRENPRVFRCPVCDKGRVWCDFFPADSEELKPRKAS